MYFVYDFIIIIIIIIIKLGVIRKRSCLYAIAELLIRFVAISVVRDYGGRP